MSTTFEQIRIEALRVAVLRVVGKLSTTASVVADAEQFRDYIVKGASQR